MNPDFSYHIFEKATDAILITDMDGRLLNANPAAIALFGYSLDELRSMSAAGLLVPESRGLIQDSIERVMSGGDAAFEAAHQCKDGAIVYLEARASAIDYDGKTAILSILRDTSARKSALSALRQSEARYRELVETANSIVLEWDRDGRILLMNRFGLEFFGYREEEIIGQPVTILVPPTDRSGRNLERLIEEIQTTPAAFTSNENENVKSNGDRAWVAWTNRAILDEQGEVAVMLAIGNDITRRKLAEEELAGHKDRLEELVSERTAALEQAQETLKRSEEYFRALSENSSDVMLLVDANGIVEFESLSVERVIGWKHGEQVGMSIFDFIHPDDIQAAADALAIVLKDHEMIWKIDCRIRHADGSWRIVEFAGQNFLHNPSINGVLIIGRDITERKEKEEQLRAANRALLALGRCNEALVRATAEDGLLQEICRVAVELAGYRFAWVGYAEHDEEKTVRPVAWFGSEESYQGITGVTWSETPRGQGLVGRAIRTGKLAVSRNIRTDPNFAPWREEALRYGFGSAIAFPLKAGGATFGALCIYAEENDSFDEHEIDLLSDLHEDLSYGIMALRTFAEGQEAEKALEESEAKYRTIFENTGAATVIIDEDTTISLANTEYARLSGYAREEVEGKLSWTDFVHPDDLAMMQKYHRLRRVDAPSAPSDYEFRYINRTGGIRQVHVLLKMIPGTAKSVASLLDITEQKQMRGSLEKLAQCFLGLGTDPFENIERILRSGGEILGGAFIGYSRMQGETLSLVSTLEGEDTFQIAVDPTSHVGYEVIRAGGVAPIILDLEDSPYSQSDPLVQKYGIKTFIGVPMASEGFRGCIGLYDTEKREFTPGDTHVLGMLARAVLIEEARISHQEGVKEFIDVAAHELRHPITILKGYADLLREAEKKMDRDMKEHALKAIDQGAERLNKLSIELLDSSYIATGRFLIKKQETILEPLITRAVGEMRERGYGNEFRVTISEAIDVIDADPVKLVTLLSILLDNAVVYSPEDSDIEIVAEPQDGEVLLSVLDRGTGISEEAREQVFDRFYQVEDGLHHSFPGIGLGLHIAREIATGHGGRIWHEPREGGGSIFRLAIPHNRR